MNVIDETEDDIRALIAADFGKSSGRELSSEFIDWLHFKARGIPRVPRKTITSTEVVSQLAHFPAIAQIRAALEAGADVSPWLSNTIRSAKQDHAADMMFNDWKIIHFHLGTVFTTPRIIKRTPELLFVHVTGEQATLIDVQPHQSWTMIALLETLQRANPNALYEFKGAKGERLTDDQYKTLRAKRINVLLDIGGKAIKPDLGIMSSGHAMRITAYYQWFLRQVERLKTIYTADQVPDELKTVIYALVGVPVRLGAWYDDYGLAIIDKNRQGLVLNQMIPLE